MATNHYIALKARVEALGHMLFIDDADDGDPRLYIHDPKIEKHVLVGVPADEVIDWCVDLETANRIAADRDLTAEEARAGLHAETVREISVEYPNADEREHRLRVAIREAMCMTKYEEDEVYEVISKAAQ